MKFLQQLLEAQSWGVEHTGEWEGYSAVDLRKVIKSLRAKPTRTKEESRRLRAADFALRAKKAHGGKWTGVKAA